MKVFKIVIIDSTTTTKFSTNDCNYYVFGRKFQQSLEYRCGKHE